MLTLLVHIIDYSKDASCYVLNLPHSELAAASLSTKFNQTSSVISSEPTVSRKMSVNPQQKSPGKISCKQSSQSLSLEAIRETTSQTEPENNKLKLLDESSKGPPILYILSAAACNKNSDVILGD